MTPNVILAGLLHARLSGKTAEDTLKELETYLASLPEEPEDTRYVGFWRSPMDSPLPYLIENGVDFEVNFDEGTATVRLDVTSVGQSVKDELFRLCRHIYLPPMWRTKSDTASENKTQTANGKRLDV